MPRTLRTRLTSRVVLLGATAALLLGTALIVLIVAVTGQRDAARTAFRSQSALTAASRLETALVSIETAVNRYVATNAKQVSARKGYLKSALDNEAAVPAQLKTLTSLVSNDPGQRRQVRSIGNGIDDYINLWARQLVTFAQTNLPGARSIATQNGGLRYIDPVRQGFARLSDTERALTRQREQRAEQGSSRAIAFGLGGLALVLAVTTAVGLYLRRAVVRPVVTVAEATGRLAAGDLDTRVPAEREDELGDLARGFNAMADSLQRGRADLERSNAELTRSNAELEQFASVTSHDLQAPLTTISMYAELIDRRHGKKLNGGIELIDGIRDATQQARTLIRDLLEYSRAGKGMIELEPMPAGEIVDLALESLAGAIDEAGATVTVGELPVVHADCSNLVRVFQNLIGNAVKFVGESPAEVSIGAEREADAWRFWVRDNGIGMSPRDIERVFEPFQRVHGEEAYPGTGIGLAVCARIVDQHGGRIWATSRPDEGSTFSFTLPVGEE